jgi:hypothetical protein
MMAWHTLRLPGTAPSARAAGRSELVEQPRGAGVVCKTEGETGLPALWLVLAAKSRGAVQSGIWSNKINNVDLCKPCASGNKGFPYYRAPRCAQRANVQLIAFALKPSVFPRAKTAVVKGAAQQNIFAFSTQPKVLPLRQRQRFCWTIIPSAVWK